MNANSPAAFLGYLNAHARPGERAPHHHKAPLPAITISRECGAGASSIAQLAASRLNGRQPAPFQPWAVFDRNLAEQVLSDHHLPPRVGEFLKEDVVPELKAAFEEFLSLHPSNWTLLQYTNETVLRLARAGHVIIVGRGASAVTADLPHVFHVRLIAPLEFRVQLIRERLGLGPDEALVHVQTEDRARRRYLQHNFKVDIADPLLYDLTINTGRTSFPAAAQLVVSGAMSRIEALAAAQ